MADLSWVKEVREFQSSIGYAENSREESEQILNAMLKDEWRIIAIVTDTKYSSHLGCPITHQFYILGR